MENVAVCPHSINSNNGAFEHRLLPAWERGGIYVVGPLLALVSRFHANSAAISVILRAYHK